MKGFLGSLCEESQWLACITSEFIQSHHSCNDLRIASLSVGVCDLNMKGDECKPPTPSIVSCIVYQTSDADGNQFCVYIHINTYATQKASVV